MKIYSWNVNGIRAVAKKGFAQWLREIQPEILCIQEVRAEYEQIPEELRAPEGYYSYWNACKRKKGYSGVGIYSQIEPDEVHDGFGIEEFERF